MISAGYLIVSPEELRLFAKLKKSPSPQPSLAVPGEGDARRYLALGDSFS
jgi:hypothetical protein